MSRGLCECGQIYFKEDVLGLLLTVKGLVFSKSYFRKRFLWNRGSEVFVF